MTLQDVCSSLREWTRRVCRRRTDDDLQRELAGHLAFAEDELRRKGHAPKDAARLARAAAGGRIQALESLREQRGLPWLGSSWLDVRLGVRLLVKNRGLTLVGGLAMTLAIGIAAFVFAAFDVVLRSPLPLHEGDRVVAIQVWDREAGRRRDTASQDVERWRASTKGSTGHWLARPMARARGRAWLNPRHRSRSRWRGMGMIRSWSDTSGK